MRFNLVKENLGDNRFSVVQDFNWAARLRVRFHLEKIEAFSLVVNSLIIVYQVKNFRTCQ
jgi:hypothetical protein